MGGVGHPGPRAGPDTPEPATGPGRPGRPRSTGLRRWPEEPGRTGCPPGPGRGRGAVGPDRPPRPRTGRDQHKRHRGPADPRPARPPAVAGRRGPCRGVGGPVGPRCPPGHPGSVIRRPDGVMTPTRDPRSVPVRASRFVYGRAARRTDPPVVQIGRPAGGASSKVRAQGSDPHLIILRVPRRWLPPCPSWWSAPGTRRALRPRGGRSAGSAAPPGDDPPPVPTGGSRAPGQRVVGIQAGRRAS